MTKKHTSKKSTSSAQPNGFGCGRALSIVWQAAAKWTVISTILIGIQALAPLATIYIFKLIVDSLTDQDMTANLDADFEYLMILIGAAFGVALIGILCNAILGHAKTIQSHLVADRMQQMVQSKSITMDLAFYENPNYFDKLHRAQREAPSRPLRIINGLTQLLRNSLMLLGAFGILFMFHWGIVVAVITASLPVVFYRLKQADAIYAVHRDKTANERLSAYFNSIITTAENAKEVRVFGFGSLITEKYIDLRKRIRAALRRISAQGARRQFVTESTSTLAGYSALAFIVHEALQGNITLGDMVMYFGAFQVAIGALRPTLSSLAEVYENNLFLSTLYEFLEVPKTIKEPTNPKQMPKPWRSGLRIENLNFQYPNTENQVLTDINMTIGQGETVALVGKNGSGKTTLTKLLCRLYDPSAGQISIDGIDIRDFNTKSLRQEIGVIYQDFGRYPVSARENIQFGRPELNPQDPAILSAAQWAGVHDDLTGLSKNYDTILSRSFADGEELSVGQWQKLALARAFLRDSQLILLDEPTSSLDPAAEFEFFEKFNHMTHKRSALVISHRFSTVLLADRIYVMDKGRIIEQGTHQTLMELNGMYAELFQKQSSYYQTEQPSADSHQT